MQNYLLIILSCVFIKCGLFCYGLLSLNVLTHSTPHILHVSLELKRLINILVGWGSISGSVRKHKPCSHCITHKST